MVVKFAQLRLIRLNQDPDPQHLRNRIPRDFRIALAEIHGGLFVIGCGFAWFVELEQVARQTGQRAGCQIMFPVIFVVGHFHPRFHGRLEVAVLRVAHPEVVQCGGGIVNGIRKIVEHLGIGPDSLKPFLVEMETARLPQESVGRGRRL